MNLLGQNNICGNLRRKTLPDNDNYRVEGLFTHEILIIYTGMLFTELNTIFIYGFCLFNFSPRKTDTNFISTKSCLHETILKFIFFSDKQLF